MFFTILQISNPLSSTIEEDLGGHMIIEHSVFFLLGYCIMSSAKKVVKNTFCKYKISSQSLFNPLYLNIKKIKGNIYLKKNRYIYIFLIISLLFFWHIPVIFDIAFYDNIVHLLQHISFIIVGMCLYMIIREFDFSFVFFSFILTCGIMGLFGLLLTLSTNPFYYPYSIQSHVNAGNYMILSSIIMMVIILPIFLIKKAIMYLDDNN